MSFLLCLTLCESTGCSLPDSSVHGILQARIYGWVAMPSSMNLPNAGIEPWSCRSPALTGGSFNTIATLGVKMSYFPLKKVLLVSGYKCPEMQRQICSFSQWIGEEDGQQLTNAMLRKATFHIWKFSIDMKYCLFNDICTLELITLLQLF